MSNPRSLQKETIDVCIRVHELNNLMDMLEVNSKRNYYLRIDILTPKPIAFLPGKFLFLFFGSYD